jgi:beta-N-acetylhexosaminidase
MIALPRGPVFLGVEGVSLTAADRERLCHPLVGGAILFARNFEAPRQLEALTKDIRAARTPSLLIAVDHEGGRVQRFRAGFSVLPPMRTLGELWDRDVGQAAREAARIGRTIADELREHGVDFSFTPVLDVDHGASAVIGDRAFHRNPNAIAHLAAALCDGLRAGGMAAVGKHFPGHGFVAADSHIALPVDERPLAALDRRRSRPVRRADPPRPRGDHAGARRLSGRRYAACGFSRKWLQRDPARTLRFDGLIFSDDLGMAGAARRRRPRRQG